MYLVWFWFYDSQVKTALYDGVSETHPSSLRNSEMANYDSTATNSILCKLVGVRFIGLFVFGLRFFLFHLANGWASTRTHVKAYMDSKLFQNVIMTL